MMVADMVMPYGQTLAQATLSPVYYLFDMPYRWVADSSVKMLSKRDLLQANARLEAQNILLKAQLHQYTLQDKENAALRKLLGGSEKMDAHFTHADIIAVPHQLVHRTVVINKGKRDRVFVGQAVMDPSGVIGHVTEVHQWTSSVMLLTDTDSYIPVQTRSGDRAIAVGHGDGASLELLDVTSTSPFRVGDTVYTSGLALRYLPGYPVGVVTAISDQDKAAFITVKIRPTSSLNRVRQVLLVWQADGPLRREAKQTYGLD
jgi:rod shape-determining protein MreC